MDTETDTQRRGYMKTGRAGSDAAAGQGPPRTARKDAERSEAAARQNAPAGLRGSTVLPIPWFLTSGLQRVR